MTGAEDRVPRFAVLTPYVARWLVYELDARGFTGATVRAHAQTVRESLRRPDLAAQVEGGWAQLRAAAEPPTPSRPALVSDDGSAAAEAGTPGASSGAQAEITTKEAADMLGVSERRVGQLLAAGALDGRKAGRVWLLPRLAVLALRDVREAS